MNVPNDLVALRFLLGAPTIDPAAVAEPVDTDHWVRAYRVPRDLAAECVASHRLYESLRARVEACPRLR